MKSEERKQIYEVPRIVELMETESGQWSPGVGIRREDWGITA